MSPVGWKPRARQQFSARKIEISQQQKNSSRAILTQIEHEPGWLEAQGQTVVQCRQNENLQEQNSSVVVSIQIGYAAICVEAQGQIKAVQRRQSNFSQQ